MRSTFDTAAAFTKTRREIERHGRHQGGADSDDLPRWLIAWVWFNPQANDQIGAVMECARRMAARVSRLRTLKPSWKRPRAPQSR